MTSRTHFASRRFARQTALLCAIGLGLSMHANSATFTYDGRLEDAGRPADGSYDIQLTPWDSSEKGTPLAVPVSFPEVKVSNGQFRIEFDAPLADSDQAWIELGVRDAGSDGAFAMIPGRVKSYSKALVNQCWSVTGDAGSDPASNFIGTLDAQPFVVRTQNAQSLNIIPSALQSSGLPITASVVAGSRLNFVGNMRGATIAGGGATSGGDPDFTSEAPNTVASHYSTVGGGHANTAGDPSGNATAIERAGATVAGGMNNIAAGATSTVSGGNGNLAFGSNSTVSGGSANCAGGNGSWAGGTGARVRPSSTQGQFGACSSAPVSGDGDGDEGTFVWSDAQGPLMNSSGANQFLVRAGGGVGINTTSIPAHADVVVAQRGTAISNVDLLLRTSGRADGINFGMSPEIGGASLYIAQYNGTTFTNRLVLSSNGGLEVTAAAFKPGGGAWSASSDARLKTDVEPMHGTLERLLSLRGVTFRYINPDAAKRPAGVHDGLIAQEVAKIFPSWVNTDSEGYLTVGSQGFEALAVEALRDLRAEKDVEIKALALENVELRARLDRIEKTLGQLNQHGEK
jgi:trimeric autotransporter adhesin